MFNEAIIFRKFGKVKASAQIGRKTSPFILRARPNHPSQGILQIGEQRFFCALGKGGISFNKREGDGATPLAVMRPLAILYRPDRSLKAVHSTSLPIIPIKMKLGKSVMGWCDSPQNHRYNRPVNLPYPASHEILFRDDTLYDVCIILDWNMKPACKNRGSAIFMHLARPGYLPTEGCIALTRHDMARVLPLLTYHSIIHVMR